MSAYESKQPPRWTTSWPEWYGIEGNTQVVPASDYEALAAEAEALEQDAARYRWLRDIGDKTWTPLLARARSAFPHVPERELPSMVDEIISGAIDAAIAKEQP